MRNIVKTRIPLATIVGIAFALGGATGLATFSLTLMENVGFGPPIHNDSTLNDNLGVLGKVIAWNNSPGREAFAVAATTVNDAEFNKVALEQLAAEPETETPSPPQ